MNFSSFKLIAIVVGLSILIVGGSYLYKQSLKSNKLNQNNSEIKIPQSSTATTDKPSTRSAQVLPALPASPSSEESQKYATQIDAMAQDADTLSLSQCKANPLVVKLKSGSKLTVRNTDPEGIVVYIGPESLSVAPGSSQTIEPKLTPAQYSVACQHSAKDYNGQAGVVYILQ